MTKQEFNTWLDLRVGIEYEVGEFDYSRMMLMDCVRCGDKSGALKYAPKVSESAEKIKEMSYSLNLIKEHGVLVTANMLAKECADEIFGFLGIKTIKLQTEN